MTVETLQPNEINQEIINESEQTEEVLTNVNDEVKELEQCKVTVESYVTLLENNIEEPMDYHCKQLLSMGMESLGYPIELDNIGKNYPGITEKHFVSVAIEQLADQIKIINNKLAKLTQTGE